MDACALTAGGGHLELWKWLREHGRPSGVHTSECCSGRGLSCTRHAGRAPGGAEVASGVHCPWDESTRALAEEYGHLELLPGRWGTALPKTRRHRSLRFRRNYRCAVLY